MTATTQIPYKERVNLTLKNNYFSGIRANEPVCFDDHNRGYPYFPFYTNKNKEAKLHYNIVIKYGSPRWVRNKYEKTF